MWFEVQWRDSITVGWVSVSTQLKSSFRIVVVEILSVFFGVTIRDLTQRIGIEINCFEPLLQRAPSLATLEQSQKQQQQHLDGSETTTQK
jgi:hypothetical protein